MEKPQLVVRCCNEFYTAEFKESLVSVDYRYNKIPTSFSHGFYNYVSIGDTKVKGLQLAASANLPAVTYRITKGGLREPIDANERRTENMARIYKDMIQKARSLAEIHDMPYFGILVVDQLGPSAVEELDKPKSEKKEEKYEIKIDLPNFKKGSRTEEWTLHPTVQLYVRR